MQGHIPAFNTQAALTLTQLPSSMVRAVETLPGFEGSELEARTKYIREMQVKGFSNSMLAQHLRSIHDTRNITTSNETKTLIPHIEMKPAETGSAYWTEFRIPGVDLSKFSKFEIILQHPEIKGEIPLVQSGFFGARATGDNENKNTVLQALGIKKPSLPSLVVYGNGHDIPGAIVPDSTAPNGFFRSLSPESTNLVKSSVQLASSTPYTLKILGDDKLLANATLTINSQGARKTELPTSKVQIAPQSTINAEMVA